MTLTPADCAVHAALGITADLLERAQVRRVDDREAREILTSKRDRLAGIAFPYLHPVTGSVRAYRVRRDHPDMERGKPKDKYISSYGDRSCLYFPPGCAALLADVTASVYVVEAEKSVLAVTCAACRVGRTVLVVGSHGCWGWRGVIGKAEDANGARVDETGPLPDFDLITWANRNVVVAFDANASTNSKVQAARHALAKELRGRGAKVRLIDLPAEPGVNGPDDYLGAHGDEAFFAIIDAKDDRENVTVDARVLEEFQDYFITQLGSKDGGRLITMVGCDQAFPPSFQSFEAFRQYYCDTRILVGNKWTTRAELWLQSKQHRKYTDVQFLPPPMDVPQGVLNLWNGFAVHPDPDPHPERRCERFLRHVRDVICAGEDPDIAEFHLDVLAAKVQRPAELTEVSLVCRGAQGVGKNTETDYYGGIFGRHAATVDKQELVTGRFNAVLSSKLVLVLDEAMWPGHKEFVGALKSLITSPTLMIERKGIDPVRERNFVQCFVLTNKDWAWPTELGDRRALILDVSDARKGDTAYFAALCHERDHGGLAALLAVLQQRVITHELRLVPHTKARDKQIALTDDDPVRSMWLDVLHRGTTWPEGETWEDFISTKDFEEYHAERCRAMRQKPLPRKLLLQQWHDMLPSTLEHPKQRRIIDRDLVLGARRRGGWPRDKEGFEILPEEKMRRGTVVPDLDTCRRHYAVEVEQRIIDWPELKAPDSPEQLKELGEVRPLEDPGF